MRPIVGARFPLEQAGEALKLIDERGATGKVVLEAETSSSRHSLATAAAWRVRHL